MSQLTDGVIVLRQYRASDVEPVFEAARESIAEIFPWMEWCHPAYSREDSANWVRSRVAQWEDGSEYSFVIEDATSGRLLGGAGLNHFNRAHRFANLGYWVRSSRTGQGAATAATRLLARLGFEDLGLERIEIFMSVENPGSKRVAEKAGAHFEGTLRRRLRLHGRQHDAHMFSLIRGELGR